jgi:hypothetical protein
MSQRPMGVTILAVLEILTGLGALLGGLGMMAVAGFVGANTSYGGILGVLGASLGIVFIIFALISFLLAWGLLGGKGWARTLAMVFAALEALFGLLGIIGGDYSSVLTLAIGVIILYYLMRPEVMGFFKSIQTPPASSAPTTPTA